MSNVEISQAALAQLTKRTIHLINTTFETIKVNEEEQNPFATLKAKEQLEVIISLLLSVTANAVAPIIVSSTEENILEETLSILSNRLKVSLEAEVSKVKQKTEA